MLNPFNPLDWIKSTQDWFARAERSSGFRPYLIYMLISVVTGVVLLTFFPNQVLVKYLSVMLIGLPVIYFLPLYTWKAHSDPDFCRSETHVQRIKKIELEAMGTESRQIPGEVLEQTAITDSVNEPPVIEHLDGGLGE